MAGYERRSDLGLIIVLSAVVLLFMAVSVVAPTESTTVTFSIPSAIGHSLGYAGTCNSGNFAFVEDDGTLDGTLAEINVTTTDNQVCQTDSVAAMTITNNGNTNITIDANFTTTLPVNVTVKSSLAWGGYEAGECSGPPPSESVCVQFNDTDGTDAKAVTLNITMSDSDDVWWWADFSNYNLGESITETRTLHTNSVEAS